MNMKHLSIFTFCLLVSFGLSAQTISFDTGTASEWSVTGGGAQNATPFVINYPEGNPSTFYNFLSVTTTGDGTGNFLQGGSLADFTGFWTAIFTFTLPSNATGINLNYNNFFADDRAVLNLNGQAIDATGIISIQNVSGSMVFTDGGDAQPYSFSGSFSSGTISSGFNIGGINTIEAIVNNTGEGIVGSDNDISSGDTTFLGLSGAIVYSVPEPSSFALAVIGILIMMRAYGKSKKAKN
jgi:hypothetical protein